MDSRWVESVQRADLVGWTQVTVVAGVPVFERSPETGPKGRVLVEPGAVGTPLIMTPWS